MKIKFNHTETRIDKAMKCRTGILMRELGRITEKYAPPTVLMEKILGSRRLREHEKICAVFILGSHFTRMEMGQKGGDDGIMRFRIG